MIRSDLSDCLAGTSELNGGLRFFGLHSCQQVARASHCVKKLEPKSAPQVMFPNLYHMESQKKCLTRTPLTIKMTIRLGLEVAMRVTKLFTLEYIRRLLHKSSSVHDERPLISIKWVPPKVVTFARRTAFG